MIGSRYFFKRKYRGKKIGEYTIEDVAGQGRFAVCFLARNAGGKKVVIKKFKAPLFADKIADHRWEAVILSQLEDGRVPELLGVINQGSFYGFVLEWKAGMTFEDLLFKQGRQFSRQEFYYLGMQLIRIIKYLHQRGIVHRDIRIPNILVDQEEIYLLDFGLARMADGRKYQFATDYSYLGDVFLYLLYSAHPRCPVKEKLPWYHELVLSDREKTFLQRLLGLEKVYGSIVDIESDFVSAFQPEQKK